MKKVVFVLVALVVAAPAFGDAVDITAAQVGSTPVVTITYNAPGKLPRAFALDITVDSGTITGISNFFTGECTSSSKGYGVFPANFNRYIDPEAPNWGDANYTPIADVDDLEGDTQGGLDTNGITIEMGSLYVPPNSPPTSGTLCNITVSGDCNVSLAVNVGRGKVVFEDGNEASPVNFTPCTVIAMATVPNVLDMNETDAIAAIVAAGFAVGATVEECNENEAADEVLDQDPDAGPALIGSDVDLWVSRGWPVVPDVVGDANQAAQDEINAVTDLSVGTVTGVCSETVAEGLVISQTPGSGATTCDNTVNLEISRGGSPLAACGCCLGDVDKNGYIYTSDYNAMVTLLNDFYIANGSYYRPISDADYIANPCADIDKNSYMYTSYYNAIVTLLNALYLENASYYRPCPYTPPAGF